jgi:lipoate-protein ligase A
MMKIIFSPSTNPSFKLAAEEFLFSTCEENFLFLYINEPSVIIGSNQAVDNEINIGFCTENDIRIFRRLSGGGAVFHDTGNLNYCFIHEKTSMSLSAGFLIPIVHALKSFNLPVETGERKDLWLNGCKISGTASHVSKNRELHHGTLLYDTDLEKLIGALNPEKQDLIRKATSSVPSPVMNIRAFIEKKTGIEYDTACFFEDFIQLLMNYFCTDSLRTFSEEQVKEISVLERRYLSEEWIYKL